MVSSRAPLARLVLLAAALLAPACGDDATGAADAAAADATPADAGAVPDGPLADAPPRATDAAPAAADAAGGCPRTQAPADRVRKVVVAHPYGGPGVDAPDYGVLDLAVDGTLADTGVSFAMGPAHGGEIVFTPDGAVGIAVQDDGTLGVFRFAAGGAVTVVHAAFAGTFYASGVTMAPTGDHAYVLDGEWRDIGGGIYDVNIGCDGTLTEVGLIAPAKLPYAMGFLPGGQALVAAADILDSTGTASAHRIALGSPPTWLAGVDAFGDTEDIVSDLAIMPDNLHALLSDNGYGVGSRVAVVSLAGGSVAAKDVLSGIDDPVAVVASPLGDTALVISGFPEAYTVFAYDAAAPLHPFTAGPAFVASSALELPLVAVAITRGTLTGHVLVSENVAIRQVEFVAGGVTDLGITSLGTDYAAMTGAMGVQP